MSDYIKRIGRNELDLLVTYMIRLEEISRMAVKKVDVEDFNENSEYGHLVIWDTFKVHYLKFQQMMTYEMMIATLERKSIDDDRLQGQVLQSIYDLVHQMYEVPVAEMQAAYAYSLMETFLMRRRFHDYLLETAEKGLTPVTMLTELTERFRSSIISSAPSVYPFGGNRLLGACVRELTGVEFLDPLLGGVRPGEVYMLLGPSGGGKTTFSHQLATTYARDRRKVVVVFSYEESITSEYMIPVYACAAHIPRKVLESTPNFENLPDNYRRTFEEAEQMIGHYLIYMDHSGTGVNKAGHGGVEEIDAALERYKQDGVVVAGVIVDWFYPMLIRKYSGINLGRGKEMDLRAFGIAMVDELKAMASNRNVWVWVTQQVASANATSKRDIEWNNAAENKSLAWFMNGCFTLGAKDGYGICTLKYSKARSMPGGKTFIQLDGDFARFKALSGDFKQDRDGNFFRESDGNKIPGAFEGGADDTGPVHI